MANEGAGGGAFESVSTVDEERPKDIPAFGGGGKVPEIVVRRYFPETFVWSDIKFLTK